MKSGQKDQARGVERAGLKLSRFARRLFDEWKRLGLPEKDGCIIVAVSGGADSTALLLALCELVKARAVALKVVVAHLDHGLRGEAGREDAQWVAELARELGCEVVMKQADVKQRAVESGDNLEQAARRVRYKFLAEAAMKCGASAVLAAHTMDDQAETVLLRLLRGSGAEGLSGMEPVRAFALKSELLLARPLLRWARRAETEEYCMERNIQFRIDEMNSDETLARVRVRRQLLPLLQTFNGRIVEALARTALLLRDDAVVLASVAEELLRAASESTAPETSPPPLRVEVLRRAPTAVRRRALRQWIALGRGDTRRLELVHLSAVEALLEGERGGRVALLPGGASVKRMGRCLRFYAEKVEKEEAAV